MSENSYKNTLCYADNSLVLIIDNITYQLENIKPSFIFEYDYLFFEPLINKYIRVLDNITYELTNEEKDDVNFYINHFDSSIDNEVYTYNDKLIYTGKMLKSEAELEFISYTTISVPEGMMVARFDKENNTWLSIEYIITDEGYLITHPDSYCDRCVLFLTEEEFDKLPEQPYSWYIFDIINNEWIDGRNINELKKTVERAVRTKFETLRSNSYLDYVFPYETLTWNIQLEEAKNYKVDNTYNTPYIDNYLKVRSDIEDIDIPTKEELIESIINNHNDFVTKVSTINAHQKKYLNRIKNSLTNEELDTIEKEVIELTYTDIFNNNI